MKVTILVAGTNEPSNSNMLADAFAEGLLTMPGTTIVKFRLKDLSIDHFTLAHYEPGTDQGTDFKKIQEAIQSSHGLVIASPIWNFGVPGHLKNLVDRMGSFGLDATHSLGTLKGLPVYFIYTGGTPAAAWPLEKRTTSHMQVGMRYFGASVIGYHYEERCTPGRGKFGLVVDKRQGSIDAMKAKAKTFGKVVDYFAKTGKLPLKQIILKTLFMWAQKVKKKLGL